MKRLFIHASSSTQDPTLLAVWNPKTGTTAEYVIGHGERGNYRVTVDPPETYLSARDHTFEPDDPFWHEITDLI